MQTFLRVEFFFAVEGFHEFAGGFGDRHLNAAALDANRAAGGAGAAVFVCRSVPQVEACLRALDVPLQARVAA